MRRRRTRGFNLIEILIVVMIIAVLASLAIPMYKKTVEKAKDDEARANLKLIQTGEKIYRLSRTYWYPHQSDSPQGVSGAEGINARLHLDLDEKNWTYQISYRAAPSYFRAEAVSNTSENPPSRTWYITKNLPDPVKQ